MENTNCEKYGLYKSNGDVSDTGKGTGKENLAGKMCDKIERHKIKDTSTQQSATSPHRPSTATESRRNRDHANRDGEPDRESTPRGIGAVRSREGRSRVDERHLSASSTGAIIRWARGGGDGTEVVAGRRGGASSLASGCEHAVSSVRGTRDWRRRGGSAPGRRRDPRGRGHVARRRAGAPPRGAGAVGHVQPGAAVHIR